ncbi:Lachesin [Nymphon striatum]|nr:Lachesin [Nymphon striatum]
MQIECNQWGTLELKIQMAQCSNSGYCGLPKFAEPVANVTVIAGRNVKMACVIDDLGKYKVTWSHLDTKTLLTLDSRVITKNERYNLSQNQRRTWWLHIHNVQPADRGSYMCQINTSPMRSRIGYLQVLVPPQIDESRTSTDVDAQENEEVVLQCEADGFPKPTVSWQREDNKLLLLGVKNKKKVEYSNKLVIPKVSRVHMGAYLCIASNNVKPPMSKMIQLRIHFAPVIWVPNQLVGSPRGSDITLECDLESFPRAMTFWTKTTPQGDDVMIITNKKYDVLNIETGTYTTQMRLHITSLSKEDFGKYFCHAKSAQGEISGKIKLYGISFGVVLEGRHNMKCTDYSFENYIQSRVIDYTKQERITGVSKAESNRRAVTICDNSRFLDQKSIRGVLEVQFSKMSRDTVTPYLIKRSISSSSSSSSPPSSSSSSHWYTGYSVRTLLSKLSHCPVY